MNWKATDLPTRLNLIGAMILLIGLGSAILIYQAAENKASGVLGYETGDDGSVYPVMPQDSKKYLRDLELYGGKANVLADRFRRWLVGLWQGKSLAFTVACITIFISYILFYVANHFSYHVKPDVHRENDGDRAG